MEISAELQYFNVPVLIFISIRTVGSNEKKVKLMKSHS